VFIRGEKFLLHSCGSTGYGGGLSFHSKPITFIQPPEIKMKIRGTDFVMYQVSNLARAARFYREILGLPQEVYSEEWQWAEFNCGNVTLSLHGGVKLPKKIAGGRIALAVKDVRKAHAELKKKRVRVLQAPQDYSVCQALVIADPDGNAVVLHQRADGTCGQ
jgi:predicted enzyme related to lactoylglutathione lyase